MELGSGEVCVVVKVDCVEVGVAVEACASECCLQFSALSALMELGSGEVGLVVEMGLVEGGFVVEVCVYKTGN